MSGVTDSHYTPVVSSIWWHDPVPHVKETLFNPSGRCLLAGWPPRTENQEGPIHEVRGSLGHLVGSVYEARMKSILKGQGWGSWVPHWSGTSQPSHFCKCHEKKRGLYKCGSAPPPCFSGCSCSSRDALYSVQPFPCANPSPVLPQGDKDLYGLLSFAFVATEAQIGYLVAMVSWWAAVVLGCLLLL